MKIVRLERTLCRVEERKGKKHWIVVKNTTDPESVGETTACGIPCQAKDAGVGSTFETILTIVEDNIRTELSEHTIRD